MQVEVANSHRKYYVEEREVRHVVKSVSRHEEVKFGFVSIVAVGNDWMRKLNRQFLGRDETTDVLAFSLGEDAKVEGEIYVNLDRARRQARDYGVSLTNEVTRLVVHGLLHLVGYSDKDVSERRLMKTREEKLLRFLDRGKILRS